MKHICEYFICLFQIDLQKMPLGKLSKRQIQSAYSLLTEVQQVSIRHTRGLGFLFVSSVPLILIDYFICDITTSNASVQVVGPQFIAKKIFLLIIFFFFFLHFLS